MKDAYYFSHDSNAHKDPKILKLRSVHGWEGYGIFWAIIETLREQDNYKWKASDKHLLSFCFANGEEKVNQVINTCLEIGLLVEENNYIYSESLTKRMKLKEEIAEKRRTAGKKGGSSKNQANAKQNESKESKVNEIKVKENKVSSETPNVFSRYQEIFGTLGSIDDQVLESYLKDGMEEKVILEAFDRTLRKAENPKFSYAKSILNNWINRGLKTLDQVNQHDPINKKVVPIEKKYRENVPYVEPPDFIGEEWS